MSSFDERDQKRVPAPGPEYGLPRVADIDSLLNGVKLSLDSTKRETTSYTVSEKESENVTRRLFEYYDKRRTGELGSEAIGDMLKDLYKGIIPNYTPSPSDIEGMRRVFDRNGDGRVTFDDLNSKVSKYLTVENVHSVEGYYPYAKHSIELNQNPLMFDSKFGKQQLPDELTKLYGKVHTSRSLECDMEHARKLFEQYDFNRSRSLERSEILSVIIDTFKLLNRDTLPSKEDVDLYLAMMEGKGDRKISLLEFETFFLRAAKRRNITVPEHGAN